jgi:hypothetical protein
MQKIVNNQVVDLTQAEIDSATSQRNDYEQNVLPNDMRAKRDALLAETDYLGLSDNTMSQAMTTYRQALRDITSHANWPNLSDSDWPTKP